MAYERNIQYDVLKGVCIYFVVCIHFVYRFYSAESKPLSFEVYNYLTSYAVPFFLIFGGFFFAKKFLSTEKDIDLNLLKKSIAQLSYRVILPYYIFVVILSCYNYLIGRPVFWRHFLFIDSNEHGLYFLIIYTYSFMWCILLSYLTQKIFSKKQLISLIPVTSLIFFPTVWLEQSQNTVFNELPDISYFCLGIPLYFLQNILQRKNYKMLRYKVLLISSALVFLLTLFLYVMRKLLGPFPVFVSSPPTIWRLFYCALGFILALNLLSFSKFTNCLCKLNFASFGACSLFIFLVHPYLIKLLVPIVENIAFVTGVSIENNLFILPVMLIAYLTTIACNASVSILPLPIRKFIV